MIKEAIEKIQALALAGSASSEIEIDGVRHLLHNGRVLILRNDLAAPLNVRTLSGIVDYIKANRDELDIKTLTVVVDSPAQVRLLGKALKDGRRAEHIIAREPDASAKFDSFVNRYMSVEDFIVGAQRHFRTGFGDLAALLAVVGNIIQGDVRQVEDDGVTQNVTLRAGITKVGSAPLPSPTMLCPRRSFPEVELDNVPFIVRVKKSDTLPLVALFECDGDSWKIDAADKAAEFVMRSFDSSLQEIPFGVLA